MYLSFARAVFSYVTRETTFYFVNTILKLEQ